MSALAPTAIAALASLGLGAVETIASSSRAEAARRARREEDAAAAAARAAEIARLRDIEDRRRREALRRAIAARRVRSSARGVGGPGGSADAVLLGLLSESERRSADARSLDDLRFLEIRRRIAEGNRRSLLEAGRDRSRVLFDFGRRATRGVSLLSGGSRRGGFRE